MFGIFVTRFAGGEPGGYLDTSGPHPMLSALTVCESCLISLFPSEEIYIVDL